MEPRGLVWIPIVIIILAVAAFTAAALVLNRPDQPVTTTNTENQANANGTTTNDSTNTNAVAVNSNGSLTVTVAQAIEKAAQYDDQQLCLSGWYQSSFEFSAMAEETRLVQGQATLVQPYVWIETTIPESDLTCTTSEIGQKACIGQITTCGTFSYAAPGEDGFGHVAAYRYKMESRAVTPSNTLKSANRTDPEQNFNLNLANTNASKNINQSLQTNVNTGATVNTADGVVSTRCSTDQDCTLIKKSREYSVCCPTPFCPEYDDSDFLAVNEASFTAVVQAAKDAREICSRVDCPQYSPPSCPTTTNTSGIAAKCLSGLCQKVFPAETQLLPQGGY